MNFEQAKAVGSSLLHSMPNKLREYILRERLGLDQPNDLALRWRVAKRVTGRPEDWINFEGNTEANNNNPKDWENIILGVDREYIEKLGGVRVVAYRVGRAVTMIGMNELRAETPILQPVNMDGTPAPDGRMLGVAMRAGSLLQAAIGIATPDGRQIHTLQTEILAQDIVVPQSIYRV